MRKLFILIISAVLMGSCGQRYEAKDIVRDFLKKQMVTDD